ncbi:MAG TPA: T9SS type A sorting domain-containing protein [Candidatus Marinimicrobia bacterium]|nr:T9SS type A sorting domain-containing protein [Candidatus Neomarinimicrobiota bacterium]
MKRMVLMMLLVTILWGGTDHYILCEGNFMTPNASLWRLSEGSAAIEGPLHWSYPQNPLGDTGQSLTIHEDKLYIIVNNSHTIEVMQLSPGTSIYERSISLAGKGPRFMTIENNLAYITCWLVPGIVILDLNTDSILESITLDGKPEGIKLIDGRLYVSIVEKASSWDKDNRLLVFENDGESWVLSQTVTTQPGPSELFLQTLSDGEKALWFINTWFDESWNTNAGVNRFEITANGGEYSSVNLGIVTQLPPDIVFCEDKALISYNGNFHYYDAQLQANLISGISKYSSIVYSMARVGHQLLVGYTDDYQAPDSLAVWNLDSFENEAQFAVGAIPGSIASYSYPTNVSKLLRPAKFQLISNYPNPFNSSTMIMWNGIAGEEYKLRMVNLLGQELSSTKVYATYDGVHRHLFQMNENSVSGLYMVQLISGKQQDSMPVIFLK